MRAQKLLIPATAAATHSGTTGAYSLRYFLSLSMSFGQAISSARKFGNYNFLGELQLDAHGLIRDALR